MKTITTLAYIMAWITLLLSIAHLSTPKMLLLGLGMFAWNTLALIKEEK